MRLNKYPAALAALALVSAPVAAQTTTSSTDTSVEGEEDFGQAGILALFAIVALAIGVIVGGGGSDDPVSA